MSAKAPVPILSLTGIRGVAALWVVAYHMFDLYLRRVVILRDGFRAVDLFFILSGFIMMHVHKDDFKQLTADVTKRFLALRVVRIYPLSIVVLLVILPFVVTHPSFAQFYRSSPEHVSTFSVAGFWQTLFLANRWFMRDLGLWNGPTWSLSVELLAYLMFPLSAFFIVKENSRLRCFLYSACVLLLMIGWLIKTGRAETNAIEFNGILRGITGFIAGMATYRLCALIPPASASGKRASLVATFTCVCLLALLLIPHAAVFSPLCFAALIGSLYFQAGWVNKILAGRVAVFFGTISYALYLVHDFPLEILQWMLKTGRLPETRPVILVSYAIYAVLMVVIAFLLHKLIERPAQKAGRRLIARWLVTPHESNAIAHKA